MYKYIVSFPFLENKNRILKKFIKEKVKREKLNRNGQKTKV